MTLDIVLYAASMLGLLMVVYVLARSGESLRTVGLRWNRPVRDVGLGAALAALLIVAAPIIIGISHAIGVHSIGNVSHLLRRWAYEPFRLFESLGTALMEEIVLCGYLLHRLRQIGWSDRRALTTSIAVRCSYHVYAGLPLVLFTVLFGFVMGRVYQRTQRLTAIVAAHALYDATVLTIWIATAHAIHQ